MKIFDKNGKENEELLSPSEKQEEDILDKVKQQHKAREGFGRFMKHPVQVLTEKPLNILIVSIPAAILVFFIGTIYLVTQFGLITAFTTTVIDDIFLISLMIACIPLAYLDLRHSMRMRNLNISLPNFFRDVAGMNESGMTLPNAIHVVATGEYGTLTQYIKKLDAEMSWNIPFVEAIYQFGERIGTTLAQRSVDLIAKASSAGGDVSEVLRAAASDTYEFVNLETERRNNMLIYVIIVIISFLVFLFVIAVMTGIFFGEIF